MVLDGKIALITGTAKGIGQGITFALAKAGADVAIVDRDVEGLAETEGLVEALGRRVLKIRTDVTRQEDVAKMVAKTVESFGQLDVAVNNAGVVGVCPIAEMSPEEWDRIHNVNLKAVFLCCQAQVIEMRRRKFGRIINLASMVGKVGMPGMTHYSACHWPDKRTRQRSSERWYYGQRAMSWDCRYRYADWS